MWQYIMMYFVSCILAYISERKLNVNNYKEFYFFSFLSIFVGAFLAGVRSLGVGTDTLVYGHGVFINAINRNFLDYFIDELSNFEPLYLLFTYIISNIFKNENVYYGIYEFIIILLIYSSLFETKKIINNKSESNICWLGLFVFYTLIYPFTLNGMRQSMAMAIIFYSFKYLYKSDLKKFIICNVIAIGFHYTAVIGILFYVMEYLLKKTNKIIAKILILFIMVISVFEYKYLISFINIFVDKYERYIGGSVDFILNPFLIRIPFLLLLIIFRKNYKSIFCEIDFWIMMLIGEILFCQLRSSIPALYRTSLYFSLIKIQAYPNIDKIFKRKDRVMIKIFLILFLLAIWYYQIVVKGNEQIYPYRSNIINWLN